jgi:hypothetical protein
MKFFTGLAWGQWFYGLMAGFIGGGANAVSSGVAANFLDPNDFAMGSTKGLQLMGLTFLGSGVISAAFYLQKHPVPDIITQTTVTTVTQPEPGTTVISKVQETEVKHAPPAEKP